MWGELSEWIPLLISFALGVGGGVSESYQIGRSGRMGRRAMRCGGVLCPSTE